MILSVLTGCSGKSVSLENIPEDLEIIEFSSNDPTYVEEEPQHTYIFYQINDSRNEITLSKYTTESDSIYELAYLELEQSPTSVTIHSETETALVTLSDDHSISTYDFFYSSFFTQIEPSITIETERNIPYQLELNETDNLAYVLYDETSEVSLYSFTPDTFDLSFHSSINLEQPPADMALHPTGKIAIIKNSDTNDHSIYRVSEEGTSFSKEPDDLELNSLLSHADDFTFSHQENILYILSSGAIESYTFDPESLLTTYQSSYELLTNSTHLFSDPKGNFIFTAVENSFQIEMVSLENNIPSGSKEYSLPNEFLPDKLSITPSEKIPYDHSSWESNWWF